MKRKPTAGPPPPPRPKRARTARPAASAGADRSDVLVIDREGALAIDDSAVLEVRETGEPPPLRVAICETHGNLAAAQVAVTGAGHTIALAAAGTDGASRVIDAIRREPIDAVVLALPGPGTTFDASGVVAAALALEPRRPVLIGAMQGAGLDCARRAYAAGADLVTLRPHDADRLAPVLLAAARLAASREREANTRGTELVLRQRLEEVARPEPGGLEPLDSFQRTLATEIKRARRYDYAIAVAMFAVDILGPAPPAGVRGILRARAGNAIVQSIRDIDIATQLDAEHFLVLLPYTDRDGAANLARRVLDTVRDGDAVTMAGRTFPPRLVASVAGATPGETLDFDSLVRDATAALEQAKQDRSDLYVHR